MEQYFSYLTQSDLYWASFFIIQVRHTSSGRQQTIVPIRHHLDTQYYSLMTFTKAWTFLFIVIRPTGLWAFYGCVSYFRPLSYSQHAGSKSGVCTRAIYNSPLSTNGITHPGNRKGQSADYCWHTPYSSQSLGYIHLETGNIYMSGATHPYKSPQPQKIIKNLEPWTQCQGVAMWLLRCFEQFLVHCYVVAC